MILWNLVQSMKTFQSTESYNLDYKTDVCLRHGHFERKIGFAEYILLDLDFIPVLISHSSVKNGKRLKTQTLSNVNNQSKGTVVSATPYSQQREDGKRTYSNITKLSQ